jgi:hypothetical protein
MSLLLTIVPGKRLCWAVSNFADLAKYESLRPARPPIPLNVTIDLHTLCCHNAETTLTHGATESRGRILGRNPDKSFKKFPPCNSQSHLQCCLEISISSNARNLLQFSTVQLMYIVKEKGGKPDRKPYPLLYSLRSPYRNLKSENCQGYCPETSTKLYVHEYGFSTRTHRSYTARWYWLAPLPSSVGLHGQA